MSLERGGLNLPLLEELVVAGASSAVLRDEGYTHEETIRARIASSLRTTSVTVSIGPAAPAKHSGTTDRQPRREARTGPTPSGDHSALERDTGTAVAPRGGHAGHSHARTLEVPH